MASDAEAADWLCRDGTLVSTEGETYIWRCLQDRVLLAAAARRPEWRQSGRQRAGPREPPAVLELLQRAVDRRTGSAVAVATRKRAFSASCSTDCSAGSGTLVSTMSGMTIGSAACSK